MHSWRNIGAGIGVTNWTKNAGMWGRNAHLLYLPRGVYAWIGSYAYHNKTNTGRAMIEIICAFAWAHGFTCDHDEVLFDKASSKKGTRVDRCLACGMRRSYPVKSADIVRNGAKWRYVSIAGDG